MVSRLATSGEGQRGHSLWVPGTQPAPIPPATHCGRSEWSWGSEGPAEHTRLLPHTDHVLAHLTPSCSGMYLGQAAVSPWPVSGVLGRLDCQSHYSMQPTGSHGAASLPGQQVHQSLRGCWSPGRYPSAPGELADHLLPSSPPTLSRSAPAEGVRAGGGEESEMYCKDVLKMCQHHLKHCKLVKRTWFLQWKVSLKWSDQIQDKLGGTSGRSQAWRKPP